jgi:hypothetical protein
MVNFKLQILALLPVCLLCLVTAKRRETAATLGLQTLLSERWQTASAPSVGICSFLGLSPCNVFAVYYVNLLRNVNFCKMEDVKNLKTEFIRFRRARERIAQWLPNLIYGSKINEIF